MPIRVALQHTTHYRYDRLVTLSPQVVRLRPAPHCRTPVVSYSFRVEPEKHFLNWQQDPHGNFLARLVFPEKTKEFRIQVELIAEMTVINPFDFFLEPFAEEYPFPYDAIEQEDLEPYLRTDPAGPHFEKFIASFDRSRKRTVDALVEFNRQVQNEVGYIIRMEPGVQTCEETLGRKSGSCRDSAWLMVQVLRHLGFAARFVSGYLIQLAPDEKPLDGPPGPEKDFTDLHAWVEAYLPGAGWIGLDPTSGLLAGEGHIPLAATPAPATAAAVTGGTSPCQSEFSVEMSVRRIHEDPRVTKPYTEETWSEIQALGDRVDRDLEKHDVRLTMGGEPTFVSIENGDAEEWNFDALGAEKRKLAGELLKKMRARFSPGAALHFGQGKWYPGEPLPRWALGCFWRKDGKPVWNNHDLVDDATTPSRLPDGAAEKYIRALAERLRLPDDCVLPAYEDVFQYLLKERRLPVNVDPRDSKMKDPQERDRLARIFEEGLGKVVGFLVPLLPKTREAGVRWASARWKFRSPHCFLLPGDSPMGYRLPLDSLVWAPPEKKAGIEERDPLEDRAPLADVPPPAEEATAEKDLHFTTALCVQPRDGRLHVFMPPLGKLEEYLALVGAVEETAARLNQPVRMEGYEPPHDPRLDRFTIAPDPGVLEVNIHPSSSWRELVEKTVALYDEARSCRLGTDKFAIDGKHTGTGGGNHVIIGGPTPADSPVLRRPDLLRSLVAYWNNHPSLSYLFSGLFIGPTSQAPRVDEARDDALYELEIAFRQIPDSMEKSPLWIVDRIFRHLLVDVTGNTHRAEFCIDKLYSPDAAGRRLGLVELRAFEMPPHARMSLAQQLLLRALVARFWKTPYQHDLVAWGTALHDRFMLPWFVASDFREVIDDLRDHGYPVRSDWFAPHIEFRFPVLGTRVIDGVELEIRQALEPWHVLGEEPAGGAQTRYVDSSVERLQIHAKGLIPGRHAVACNTRRVPIRATGVAGEGVAGVRYRAWQPPSCLHPTIPV
ncbi:MAG: transglutaminase family protein, partial [Candidatus Hydrogenedentota bacterium]